MHGIRWCSSTAPRRAWCLSRTKFPECTCCLSQQQDDTPKLSANGKMSLFDDDGDANVQLKVNEKFKSRFEHNEVCSLFVDSCTFAHSLFEMLYT